MPSQSDMLEETFNATTLNRHQLVRCGEKLEYFTIAWNSLEALASIVAGGVAGSVALIGFGLDSLIEVTSGVALLWRLDQDKNTVRRERADRLTLRIVGACFLLLSAYIAYSSLDSLLRKQPPARSVPGIVVAV